MRKSIIFLSIVMLTIAFSSAYAQENEEGRRFGNFCSSCHGTAGAAVSDAIPSIGGQHKDYLKNSMMDMKPMVVDGKEQTPKRYSTLMKIFLKGYSESEIEAMADWYSSRPWVPTSYPLNQDLVAKAKVAKEQGYQSSSISATISNNALSISSDGSYYVSDEITVSSTNVDEYNVEIAEGPSNTVAIDSNGTAKTTFAANETFRVQVPVSDVDDSLVNIKVNISATGKVYKAYEYQPENDNQQNVTPSVISPVEENVNTSIDLTISTSKVTIVKIDQSTGQPLAGAVIVIKDADGNEVARFTSTTDPYVLTGLKDGTYTVEEVQAPEGYQKSNKVISFTLDSENVSQQITIENYPEISVPNTNTASSILLVILGLGIIGGGIKFVQKKSRI